MNINKYNHNPIVPSRIRIKLIAVIKQFINAAMKGEILTNNGEQYKKGTIRTYLTFMLSIEAYEKEYGTIYIDEVDILWVELYKAFLTQMNMSKNSIATNVAKLKAIMNRAHIAGVSYRSGFGFKAPREITSQVYMTWNDLKLLHNHEFVNEGERRVRDIFIMHCFMGMRISDFMQFVKSPKNFIRNIDGKIFIEYYSQKTNIKSVVPMHVMVRKILERNNYDFGRKFSYQHYNYYLKILCEKAGLTETIRKVITKGGVRIESEKQKWEMVSSHTARRTFASLAELSKVNRPAIMKITGHKSENSFVSYIRISELESAMGVYEHDFFKVEL